MTKVFLTNHSKVRFSERTNITDYERTALEAFRHGHEFVEYKEPVFSFLKSVSHCQGAYVAKIYENNVYIFNNRDGHRLLTVYAAPEEYLPLDQYLYTKEELAPCFLILIDKKDESKKFYWGEFGLETEIEEALEFSDQRKANNYIYNNTSLQNLMEHYEIVLC